MIPAVVAAAVIVIGAAVAVAVTRGDDTTREDVGTEAPAAEPCRPYSGAPAAADPEQDGWPRDVTAASGGDPNAGGELRVGLADDDRVVHPLLGVWSTSTLTVANAVYDPLVVHDADGLPQPYVAETVVPNDDCTEWTIELREGIEFHDGTPLDAEAVAANLTAHAESPLSAGVLAPLTDVETTDDLTVTVSASTPWSTFPAVLASRVGYVASPSTLDDPSAEDVVGTGPFVFEGQDAAAETTEVSKNEGYWREGLPYLDEISFVSVPDDDTRLSAVMAGDLDVADLSGVSLGNALESDDLQVVVDRGEAADLTVVLNTQTPPFDDPRVRAAAVAATDPEEILALRSLPESDVSTGPFTRRGPWARASDDPSFDPTTAEDLLAEVEADTGEPVSVELVVPPGTDDQLLAELLSEQWSDAGFDVEVRVMDVTAVVANLFTGEFEAQLFSLPAADDPDLSTPYLSGSGVFAGSGLDDDELDDAIATGRAVSDPDDRHRAYDVVQRRISELAPYVWIAEERVGVAAADTVQGLTDATLPSGDPAQPFTAGALRPTELWLG